MIAALGPLLARWRADRGLLALLVLVVAVTVMVASAVPRLLDQLQEESLAVELDRSTPDRRGLEATLVRSLPRSPEALGSTLDELGADVAAQRAPVLADVLGPRTGVVDSLRYSLSTLPGEPPDPLERSLTVRMQTDLDGRYRLVDGRLPDGQPGTAEFPFDVDDPSDDVTLPVYEVLVSVDTAESLGLEVGDRRFGAPDSAGPVAARILPRPDDRIVVELAGVVELDDIDDPIWFGERRLHRAGLFETDTTTRIFAFAVLPPELVGELPGTAETGPAGWSWRWRLDRDALLRADTAQVSSSALLLRTTSALTLDDPSWSTGLDRLLDREAARRATATEVLGLAVAAVVAVAGVVLAGTARLLADRRRRGTALVRGRGTSRGQLVVAGVIEAGVLALAGLAVGLAAVVALLVGDGGTAPAALVALGAVVVLVAAGLRDARRTVAELVAAERRDRPEPARPGVLDGLLVVVALVAAIALRRRGVVVDGDVDPLVVVAPTAVAVAAAVVAARLVPAPLRGIARSAARRPGLGLAVGTARAARRADGGAVVVLVALGVAVTLLSAGVHASLVAGQQRAALEAVGSDVRVRAAPLTTLTSDSPEDLAGVTLVAELSETNATVLAPGGAQAVDLVLADEGARTLVSDGGPELTADPTRPAPVVLSAPFRVGSSTLDIGDEVTLLVGSDRVQARVTGFAPRLLGRDSADDGAFAVVAAEAVTAVTGDDPLPTTRLVATSDPGPVADAAAQANPDAQVLVREDVLLGLRDSPLAAGVRIGFLVATGTALVATLLAMTVALAAAADARRRESAVLGAVGAGARTVRVALLAEVVPTVALAALAGTATAGVLAGLVRDGLDLSPFSGTVDPTRVALPSAAVVGAVLAVVLLSAAVAALATLGRPDPARVLREADT